MEQTNNTNEMQPLTSDDKQMIKEAICSQAPALAAGTDATRLAKSLIQAFSVVNNT
ncbi:hypothetical protein [Aquitalea magnusonii]|uniref:Uncharacterized protein n=1 Tax=Aquitalea magnusonii TaxID=332411 RepID=A0A318K5B3_9NEIS|nr:hypothetical protein [Aquitalea magnusonii]PXX49014.1 hypothetical protein DFR38_10550 [Aquitalea magnusonii]